MSATQKFIIERPRHRQNTASCDKLNRGAQKLFGLQLSFQKI